MSAHTSEKSSDLLLSGSFSRNFKDDVTYMPQPEAAGRRLANVWRALWHRLGAARERWQISAELRMLDERTLSDIGLIRAELPLLFDPDFAARFNTERGHFRGRLWP